MFWARYLEEALNLIVLLYPLGKGGCCIGCFYAVVWDFYYGVAMDYIVRVDDRGRIVVPSKVRESLNIGRALRLRVEGGKIVLEPFEDPLEGVSKLVVRVSIKASREPEKISEVAYEQLARECRR